MDLKKLYTLETGQNVAPKGILGVGASFSNEYVKWLENRLSLHNVVGQSEQLLDFVKFCKNENGLHIPLSYISKFLKDK